MTEETLIHDLKKLHEVMGFDKSVPTPYSILPHVIDVEKVRKILRIDGHVWTDDEALAMNIPFGNRSLRSILFPRDAPDEQHPLLPLLRSSLGRVMAKWITDTNVQIELTGSASDHEHCSNHSMSMIFSLKKVGDSSRYPVGLTTVVRDTANHVMKVFMENLPMQGGVANPPARIFFNTRKSYVVFTIVAPEYCYTVRMCTRMHRFFPPTPGQKSKKDYAGALFSVHRCMADRMPYFSDPFHQRTIKVPYVLEDMRPSLLAFAMGGHARLGAESAMRTLDLNDNVISEILKQLSLVERVRIDDATAILREVFVPTHSDSSSLSSDSDTTSSDSTGESESDAGAGGAAAPQQQP